MAEFKDLAEPYRAAGLSPIPIESGTKRPAISKWTKYCKRPPQEGELEEWSAAYPLSGLGLALGTEIDQDFVLIAVDVDDEEMITPVIAALGTSTPSKIGKKGITIFVKARKGFRSKKIKRKDADGSSLPVPSVELLASGNQTVIPPTLHPDTKQEYFWKNGQLLDHLTDITEFTDEMLDEITAICTGKGQHFIALNAMTWRGVGGGGDTHDTCVSAVSCMVARQWRNPAIHARISRAKRDAVERAHEEYDWPGERKAIQEWIDSARAKGMDELRAEAKTSKVRIPPERTAAEWAVEKLFGGDDNVVVVDGIIRKYSTGYWKEVDEGLLRKAMLENDRMLSFQNARAACDVIRDMYRAQEDFGRSKDGRPERYDEMLHRVCLQNCTINLVTGETSPHAKGHELIHQLPFEWDDRAVAPIYMRVVHQTFDKQNDAVELWDEYCAHTLIPDMHFQRLLFLVGPGGNGKGTLARVLSGMHDPRAVGSVSVTDLGDERKRTSLIGKLVNISGEQSYLRNVSDVYLKKITGGDPIDCRKLYGETMPNIKLKVRFLEMTNEMPTSTDSSDALRRRLMILQTPNRVRRPDLDLDAKLDVERPGILRIWVEALARLYHRGTFLEPRQSKQAVTEYIEENDPVNSWMVVRTEAVRTPQEGDSTTDLYADFAEWAKAMGFKQAPNVTVFGRRLTYYGYPAKQRRLPSGTLRMRALKLKR